MIKTIGLILGVVIFVSCVVVACNASIKDDEMRANQRLCVTLYSNDGVPLHTYHVIRRHVHEWSTSLEIDGIVTWRGNYLIQPE